MSRHCMDGVKVHSMQVHDVGVHGAEFTWEYRTSACTAFVVKGCTAWVCTVNAFIYTT